MADLEIRKLVHSDAHAFAPLLAENAQALKRGAPRRPDEVYAEQLIGDKTVELIGAFDGSELVGFAAFFDLPDLTSGRRIGSLEDIYVVPDHQSQGIGRAMVRKLAIIGTQRDWLHIRWLVPARPIVDIGLVGLYERIGAPGDKATYHVELAKLLAD
ncbi:GNAT family N-acetyltransferase [Polycladidibacter hongkongensis]|uniref:GNAT family N-acetyltransferase n=1 Tax=Polycladidibacter hongkongensis TaxID=1647556 RepID=UPI0008332420|nr:GNAT family N-acetyltransferase [Pseudovibrio hongkongensis]